MKNNRYIFAAAAALLLVSCEEIPDYQKTIDAAPLLAYINSTDGNWHSATLTHKPDGTVGGYKDSLVLKCNSANHETVTVGLAYDAAFVDEYNAANGTSYLPLPSEYILLENASLAIGAGEFVSADTVKISLAGDFSALVEREYLCALKVESPDMASSQEKGAYYLEVLTEVSRIRPVTSEDEITGDKPSDRSSWIADCDGYEALFDGNTSAYYGGVSFEEGQSITVDMQEVHRVTGLDVAGYVLFSGIEYSTDGQAWEQAGSLIDGEYISSYSGFKVAFYDYLEARYIRFVCHKTSSWYSTIAEFNIYETAVAED